MRLCLSCNNQFVSDSWYCPECHTSPKFQTGFPSFAPELSSDNGFKDSIFHELIQLEASNFWFQSRNKLIIWALNKYFSYSRCLLEIGCGTGFVLSGIAANRQDLKLSGSEISSAGLHYASTRCPSADLFQMDGRHIPFVGEFDIIGAFDVLEHINEDELVINQMYKALKPGGGILLTVPQHSFLWSRADEYACHVRRYSANDLITKVTNAGFQLERVLSFVSLLLPFMMMSRMLRPAAEPEFDPLQELRIGGIANSIMNKIMDFERLTIRAGASLPFGGSLMLIARKNT